MDDEPDPRRHAAEDFQQGQYRPAPSRRAARSVQLRPVHRRRRAPRPATCWARCTSTSWRSSPAPRASAAASSTRPPVLCACWWRCSSRTTAACTTRAAGPAACSCRPRSSSNAHGGKAHGHLRLRPGTQRAHVAHGEDEPRHPRHQRATSAPRWGDTFARDQHPDLQADFVMANPPFNIKDWARSEDDPRWKYGVPPAGNANYAWIQHIISKLAPGGSAGVVMANGSMSSNSGGEGDIRAQLVEADLVSCMVALPTQLFRSTGIPVCMWFFAKDKTAGEQGSIDRTRADAVHRRPQPRLHGRPRRACAVATRTSRRSPARSTPGAGHRQSAQGRRVRGRGRASASRRPSRRSRRPTTR